VLQHRGVVVDVDDAAFRVDPLGDVVGSGAAAVQAGPPPAAGFHEPGRYEPATTRISPL
jgi:hypothetical protein